MSVRFFVDTTFHLSSRSIVVFAGSIVEGEIRKGMKMLVDLNKHSSFDLVIHSIEFLRKEGGDRTGLCVKYGNQEELDLTIGLNITQEEIRIIS